MTQSVDLENGALSRSREEVEFLSQPSDYSMADEWYEFVTADHFWFKWRFAALRKMIPDGYDWGQILDIGCGNGIVGDQIEKCYGQKACGCDLNLKALQMNPPDRGPVYFYNIHERHEMFKEKFSTIVLLDVLEHIDDPVMFLQSVGFHMKPESCLIINVPALPWLYSKYDQVAGHVQRYTTASLTRELKAAGFEVEKTAYWGMSMIPLLLLRKLVLCFCPQRQTIRIGFQPSPLMGWILDGIRRMECGIFSGVPIGSSLMVVAKRKA